MLQRSICEVNTMKKGINGWTFAPGTPLRTAAEAAARAGFQTFEPTFDFEGELNPQTTEAECQRLGESIRETGLSLSSLATGIYWSTPFTSTDPAVRAKAHDLTLAYLDKAHWMHAPTVLVLPGMISHWETGGYLVSYPDALRYACDALQQLVPEAEARGVVIAVENVWNNFLVSPVEMRDFLDRVNSGWVGAYLDTGNVLRYGVTEDWVHVLGPRIVRVHLKDYNLKVGGLAGFCPLGDGDVNWPAVINGLKASGYDGPLTYEGPGEPAEIARRIDRVAAAGQ
jgi:L-ribulose-5-phosphate 3-epimerase